MVSWLLMLKQFKNTLKYFRWNNMFTIYFKTQEQNAVNYWNYMEVCPIFFPCVHIWNLT